MYRVIDCMDDTLIEETTDENQARDIQKTHGGVDNCIHVFKKPEIVNQQKQPERLFVNEPKNGELF